MDEKLIASLIKEALVPFKDKLDILCTKSDLDGLYSKLCERYENELAKRDERINELEDRFTALEEIVMKQKIEIDKMQKNMPPNLYQKTGNYSPKTIA